MSHTKRIYNNPNLKKTQIVNLDDGNGERNGEGKLHMFVGIPLTRRSWICMGRCKMCRDHNREPRLIRKILKEQFRFDIKMEFDDIKREFDGLMIV